MRASQDIKKAEEFNSLRDSIKKRIDDLDNFFEDNFDEEFIFYFERGRYKLKKLLMYEPNLLDEIDNGKNIKALIFGQKPNVSQSTPDIFIDQDTEMTKFSNNYFMNKNNSKSYQIFSENNISKNNNNYNNKTNTNASNNTYKLQIKNNINRNRIKTSNNNTNSKSNNKNFPINTKSNLSYNYYINDSKKNMIKNNIKSNNNIYNYNYNNSKNNNKNKINNNKNMNYNNYYNKDIRKKYSNTNSDEDTEEKKENKIKYLDWTENNTIQQNTMSNQINTINNTNTNGNIENNETNNSNRKPLDTNNSNKRALDTNNSFKKSLDTNNSFKKPQKIKKNKRDTIFGPDINIPKLNNLNLNKTKKNYNKIIDKNNYFELVNNSNNINKNINNNSNINSHINSNNNTNNSNKIEPNEMVDDSNVIKIDFFDDKSKDRSLSEITSNRKGEIEDSIISQPSLNKEQYKEILFQIKLNKEEYRLLLREKAKIINPLK